MGSMLRHGHVPIAKVRNPHFQITGLQSGKEYFMILVESLFRKVICSDYAVIAKKV